MPSTASVILSCTISCSTMLRCMHAGSWYVWPATKRLTSSLLAFTSSLGASPKASSMFDMKRGGHQANVLGCLEISDFGQELAASSILAFV
jgi:hypothetical protein